MVCGLTRVMLLVIFTEKYLLRTTGVFELASETFMGKRNHSIFPLNSFILFHLVSGFSNLVLTKAYLSKRHLIFILGPYLLKDFYTYVVPDTKLCEKITFSNLYFHMF